MSKTTRFMVEIVTEDKIVDDNEKNEMAQKIADALVHECRNGEGIVPEASETFTKIIYVKEWYSDKQIIEHP
jgi:hypothetical protein